MAGTDATGPPRRGGKAIGLVCTGHFFAHFYVLLLPPLFPLLRDVYGVGFTELGLAVTAFNVTTALTQAPVGFLVDRHGARGILMTGIVVESVAFVLIGTFPNYGMLIALMVVAGLGNSVFHPAGYSILNASVASDQMGRAFSLHTFAGFVGGAVAPATVIFITTVSDWRTAIVLCGALGLVVAMLMWFHSAALLDVAPAGPGEAAPSGTPARSGIRLLCSLPVVTGLLFFVGIAMITQGIGGFGVSALTLFRGATLAEAGALLSAYLFAAPVGVLIGGWIADRIVHHERFAALCFVVVAGVFAMVAATDLAQPALVILFGLGGLFFGLVAPSRDMMIRAITPPGEIGKVFGFVSTGFSVSGMIAPVMFGYVLDHLEPRAVFWIVAAVACVTIVTVLTTGRRGARPVTASTLAPRGG